VFLIEYIKNSLSKVANAAGRFPLVTLSAVLSFVLIVIYFHFYLHFEISRRQWVFMAFECLVGISMFLAFALFAEKHKVDLGKRIGLGLMGLCILSLHYYAIPNWAISIDSTSFLRFLTFWIIFALLVSFILFYKESEKLAFWQFNQYLFIQFFLSTAFSLALFVGIASSFYAIENIFDITIEGAYYTELAAFFGIVINTLFFSASLPSNLNSFTEPQSFRQPLRLFIQYVLLPVLLIYYVILIIYFGKIVLSGVLPNGWVALPLLLFSMLGSLTFFLAYPFSYDEERTSIRFFIRYFFYFLLPLLSLIFAALITRVGDYGFTEYRYLGLLLGFWLVTISLYTILRKKVSLVVFPISLFLLLFLGSVGPWGMYQFSARSQYNRLCKMLTHEGLIQDKVLDVERLQARITDSLSTEIGAINTYLFYREKIHLVYPILAEKEKKRIDSIKNSDNKIRSFNAFLSKTFSLPQSQQLADYRRYHFYTSPTDSLQLDITQYQSFEKIDLDNTEAQENVTMFLLQDTLKFVYHKDTFSYQMFPHIDSITAYYFAQPDLANLPFDEYVNIQANYQNLSFKSQDKKSEIVFKELLFKKNSDATTILETASFYFFK